MIDLNFKPTPRQLRQFAATAAVAIPVISWLWIGFQPQLLATIAIPTWIVLGIGAAIPSLLRYPFIGLSVLFYPIGLVVSEALLLIMFFLIVLPAGLIFRLSGKDTLQRRKKQQANSYWFDKETPKDVGRYFKQY